jgi:hypothetical protein
MSETTKELIELAITHVSMQGGTVVVEDEKTNKKFNIYLSRSSNEVTISIQ